MKGVKLLHRAVLLLVLLSLHVDGANVLKATSDAKSVVVGDEVTITVYVTDASNYAMSDARIKFSVVSGGGSVKPDTVSSNSVGVAKAVFVTGDAPALNVLKIESGASAPVMISIEGKESPPADFSISFDQDKFYPETSGKMFVYVKNLKNKPSANIPVTISSTKMLVFEQTSGKTDAKGKLVFGLQAGKETGAAKIEISAGTLPSQMKEVVIHPFPITSFSAVAEPYAIYTKSGTTIKAKASDSRKKPVGDLGISFKVTEGDAVLESAEAVTTANGTCSVKLKSGASEGAVVVRVKIINKEKGKDVEPALVNINVTKLILPPAKLELKAEHPFATAGDDVALIALVSDKEGNPVSGAAVNFETAGGNGKISTDVVSTGKDGKAVVTLRTGIKAGVNVVKASCEKLPIQETSIKTEGKVTYARKNAGAPARFFVYLSKKAKKTAVCALFVDSNYIPVKGVQADFKIIKGKGSLEAQSARSDANGIASVFLKPEGGSIDIQVGSPAVLENKGIVYTSGFPILYIVYPVAAVFLVLLLVFLVLRGKSNIRYLDPFTGLHNELFAKYRLKKAIKNKKKFTALFLDLNHFKYFNTVNGYEKGNELILGIADILKANVGKQGTVCHLGGDDFVAIIDPDKSAGIPEKVLQDIAEKIKSFYPEKERTAGLVHIKDETGKEFSHPLSSVSIAVLESERFPVLTFNEFLDKAGKVMKSAKSKGDNAVSYDVDYNSDTGRQYKIGWFTVIGFLFAFLVPSSVQSQEALMNLSAWANSQSAGAGKEVIITAHVTDSKERPVSNVFIVFSVEKGDGYLDEGYSITDDSGNCSINFCTGKSKGLNSVKIYGEGLLPVEVEVVGRLNGTEVFSYFSIFMLLVFVAFLIMKIKNMRLLLRGIDKDGGYMTRFFAEQQVKKLSASGNDFVTVFIQFRDFQEYCKVYGYDKGDNVIKSLSDYIKDSVLEAKGRPEEIFYYWQDRFAVVSSSLDASLFAKELIGSLEATSPVLCEDKSENFYTLHLLVAQIESSKLKVKGLEEIMDIGETLINKSKVKSGNSSLSYTKYLQDEQNKKAAAEAVKKAALLAPKTSPLTTTVAKSASIESQPKVQVKPASTAPLKSEETKKRELDERKVAEEWAKKEAAVRKQAEEKAKQEMDARLKRELEEHDKKEAIERARREAEEKSRKAQDEQLRKESEERIRQQLETTLKKEMEERSIKDAKERDEERARRDAEEKTRREAEEKTRQELEERIRREVAEKAVLEAAKNELAEKEKEERLRRETEEKAIHEAESKLRKAAEDKARKLEEEMARREAEEKVRHEAEEKIRREAEEKGRKEFEERLVKELEARLGKEEERLLKEIEARVKSETKEKHGKEIQEQLLKELETRVNTEEAGILREMGGSIDKEASDKLKKEAEEKVLKNIAKKVTEGKEEFMLSIEEKVKKDKEKLAKRLAEESEKEAAAVKEEKASEEALKKEAEEKGRKEAEERLKKEEAEKLEQEKNKLLSEEKSRKEAEEKKIKEQSEEEGRKDEEIVFLESQTAADPENLELHVKLSDLYFAKNMKQKAVEKLLFLADNFYESKLYKYALKYYLRAVEIDQSCVLAREKVAQIYIHDDMDREAKLEFLSIAELYLAESNVEKAQEFAEKAIEYKSLEAHYILGAVYYKRGLLSEAAGEMTTLLKIKPYHLKALQYLFYFYITSMDFMQALTTYEKMLSFEPKYSPEFKDYPKEGFAKEGMKFLMSEVDSLVQKKLMTEAMRLVQTIIDKWPLNIEIKAKLASLLEVKGLFKDAAKGFREVRGLYLGQGKREEAEKYGNLADKLDPPAGADAYAKKEKKNKVSYL